MMRLWGWLMIITMKMITTNALDGRPIIRSLSTSQEVSLLRPYHLLSPAPWQIFREVRLVTKIYLELFPRVLEKLPVRLFPAHLPFPYLCWRMREFMLEGRVGNINTRSQGQLAPICIITIHPKENLPITARKTPSMFWFQAKIISIWSGAENILVLPAVEFHWICNKFCVIFLFLW